MTKPKKPPKTYCFCGKSPWNHPGCCYPPYETLNLNKGKSK